MKYLLNLSSKWSQLRVFIRFPNNTCSWKPNHDYNCLYFRRNNISNDTVKGFVCSDEPTENNQLNPALFGFTEYCFG